MLDGQHCGGSDKWMNETWIIETWKDGTEAHPGKAYSLSEYNSVSECKRICNAHSECKGFNKEKNSAQCGFWMETMNPQTTNKHDCYKKTNCNYIFR